MRIVQYGRRRLAFSGGKTVLTSTSVTERVLPGENEEKFLARLMKKYAEHKGAVEIVFKAGKPDYAIITIEEFV